MVVTPDRGLGVELFTDVVVARPGLGYPYQLVERITVLILESRTVRGYDTVPDQRPFRTAERSATVGVCAWAASETASNVPSYSHGLRSVNKGVFGT